MTVLTAAPKKGSKRQNVKKQGLQIVQDISNDLSSLQSHISGWLEPRQIKNLFKKFKSKSIINLKSGPEIELTDNGYSNFPTKLLEVSSGYGYIFETETNKLTVEQEFKDGDYVPTNYAVKLGIKKGSKPEAFFNSLAEKLITGSEDIRKNDFVAREGAVYANERFVLGARVSTTRASYTKGATVTLFFTLYILIKEEDVSFLDFINERAAEDERVNITGLVKDIINSYWVEGKLNPIYNPEHKITETFTFTGTVKLGTGKFFYFPKDLKDYDKRSVFFRNMSVGNIPNNYFVMMDTVAEQLRYTSRKKSVVSLNSMSLAGYMKITDEDISRVFNYTLKYVFFDELLGKAIPNLYDLMSEKFKFELDSFGTKKTLVQLKKEDLRSFIAEMDRILNKLASGRNIRVPNFFQAKGIIELIKNNIDTVEETINTVRVKREKFNSATKKDLPPTSNCDSGFSFLPHQAEVVSKLNAAGETSIIDVSPGGGKTFSFITDIVNCLKDGKVKRPLVVMPLNLIYQWVDEISTFSNGKINAFPITIEVKGSWSPEELDAAVTGAPPNTIFLTSYSFLRNGSDDTRLDGKVNFPNVEWIKKVLNPDYVGLDESQYIKNPNSNTNKAVSQLRTAKYRRIGTGTLITNNPYDLIGQASFIDPGIVGDVSEFESRYMTGGGKKGRRSQAEIQEYEALIEEYGGEENIPPEKRNVKTFYPDFRERISNDLRSNTFYMCYREKDWGSLLPDLKSDYHYVNMTSTQQAIYNLLVQETFDSIEKDPRLKDAYIAFTGNLESTSDSEDTDSEENEEIDEDTGVVRVTNQVLGAFQVMEQYLSAPEKSKFVEFLNKQGKKFNITAKDLISPKVGMVDRLIKQSLDAGQKVFVATHFKMSAAHLMENSQFKSVAAYYDADNKSALHKFREDPNVKVLFTVAQSLQVGLNLQAANRIIMADIDWTPGNLKQLIGRIFRPHLKKDPKTGELKNLNEGKTVYIDYVICDQSADSLKMSFNIYKKVLNSSIMELCPIEVPTPLQLSKENFIAPAMSPEIRLDQYFETEQNYMGWYKQEIDEAKAKGFDKLVPVKAEKDIPGTKKIDVPWVKGMSLPIGTEYETITDFLSRHDIIVNKAGYIENYDKETGDLIRKLLIGRSIVTQFGQATITKLTNKSIGYVDANGTDRMDSYALIMSLKEKAKKAGITKPVPAPKPIDTPKVIEPVIVVKPPLVSPKDLEDELAFSEDEELDFSLADDNSVTLELGVYNNAPTLVANIEDPDSADLTEVGFKYQAGYYAARIKTKKLGLACLEYLKEKYEIAAPVYEYRIISIIKQLVASTKKVELPEEMRNKNFYNLMLKKSEGKEIRPYIWLINDEVFIVIDKKSHPNVKMHVLNRGPVKWEAMPARWYKMIADPDSVVKIMDIIESELGIDVVNGEDLMNELDDFVFIKPKRGRPVTKVQEEDEEAPVKPSGKKPAGKTAKAPVKPAKAPAKTTKKAPAKPAKPVKKGKK